MNRALPIRFRLFPLAGGEWPSLGFAGWMPRLRFALSWPRREVLENAWCLASLVSFLGVLYLLMP